MTYRGTVRGNTILLEEGAHLPDGASVDVRLAGEHESDEKRAIEWLSHNRIKRYVGMDEIIQEMKRERDERDEERIARK